ncbi:hypothetical protein M501DRAFT_1013273 [Patellaria atrata CBS 101060]|uniref:Secreted protein n=1 Tax=Patellaria atrata CBS 101060 TaxID=1346257 RepID=A0A9P4VVP4_9PEZI|nr:hypothetical protein M501DRAFT_1013273 [Patellaria atrata CBS 101060]
MKVLALLSVSAAVLVGQAAASLNCTVTAPTVTQRYCEWEGCQVFATAVANKTIHAGCRADCSTNEDPWFQLYDGSFLRTNELSGCRYHCLPYAITGKPLPLTPLSSTLSIPKQEYFLLFQGLPYCWEERNLPSPTNCAASSSSGLASAIPAYGTLGPEPPPFGNQGPCSLDTRAPFRAVMTPAPRMVEWKA